MSLTAKITAKVVTTRAHEVRINDFDMRLLLTAYGVPVSPDAEIFVEVPGGGDWSNTDLSINSQRPVIVRWTTRETAEEE